MTLRFAPSPTGLLHVGNLRTAIINWLIAKKNKQKFLLRIDDTDCLRSKEEYVTQIKKDLSWVGLNWDESYSQSSRMDSYNESFEYLKKEGLIYPCYETDEELNLKRARQRSAGLPPVYDRSSLSLSKEQINEYEYAGRKPYWRLKLPNKPIIWTDKIFGEIKFDTQSHSDPVVVRADGRYLYTITSVVDDIFSKIGCIVRGSDHLTNTGVQVYLFQILGSVVPDFVHHPLMTGLNGEPLSKRIGSLSIDKIRQDGIEPEVLLNYLTFIGGVTEHNKFYQSLELSRVFDLPVFSKSNSPFDEKLMNSLNANFLQKQNSIFFKNKLSKESNKMYDLSEEFWEAIKNNIKFFKDINIWAEVIYGEIQPIIEDLDYINIACSQIPDGDFNTSTWEAWTKKLKKETGRSGKGLFLPLRLALTGKNFGPEMPKLLNLIGKEKTIIRLSGKKG